MLIYQGINFKENFNLVLLLVKLPLTAIDDTLIPLFNPPLKDTQKYWGKRWSDHLPDVHDPAEKFALVTKITIVPEQAKTFVRYVFSSV